MLMKAQKAQNDLKPLKTVPIEAMADEVSPEEAGFNMGLINPEASIDAQAHEKADSHQVDQ